MGLLSKIKNLPNSPGVYEFLDAKGHIIYVGKARNLKKRVMSYFKRGQALTSRLLLLTKEAKTINIIKTSSEAEALIHEAALIKEHSPRFNVELKDDKSYPFLKLTIGEKYPRLFLTRIKHYHDDAVYYGPYVNVKLLREALSFIKKVFPIRTCCRMPKSVCLEYHIDQCVGPCAGKASFEDYRMLVEELRKFLEGRKKDLLCDLREKMNKFSREKEYEKALLARKRIEALQTIHQLHDRVHHPIYGELDGLKNVLGMAGFPSIIECFDISNIGAKDAVGSVVRFVMAKPKRDEYRRFRIKGVTQIDDYTMIREIVRRRFVRLLNEKKTLPNVVLIDGGKGHLSVAKNELRKLGLEDLKVASIAKEYNHLYVDMGKEAIKLSPGSRLLGLIQRIRDEAHRFAITYHRNLRSRKLVDTELREIEGIGPKRERMLLERFGTLENISRVSRESLEECGVGKKAAQAVIEHFR